jgi:C_GCAxxG_C_C family probable redox protein
MNRTDQALTCFLEQGCNCAQATFVPYAPDLGVDRDTALRLAAPFGGGVCRRGEVCGAVTGALMALGLRFAPTETDPESKARTYAVIGRFLDEFGAAHGSIVCRDLLGCDLSTPEGQAESKEKGLHQTVCAGLVRSAAEILERMLAD